MKRLPIKDLSAAAIEKSSVNFDFSEGYAETWEAFEATECPECGKIVFNNTAGEEQHRYIDSTSKCDGYISFDGPMMNYYYPIHRMREELGLDLEASARAIAHLPLCIVDFVEENFYGLALTGGGMDLSWEIAEAHMRLGYLPPAWLNLPHFGGMKLTPVKRWIMAGLEQSNRYLLDIHKYKIRDIRSLRKHMGK